MTTSRLVASARAFRAEYHLPGRLVHECVPA
jgi:hypothetical protein